MKSKGLLALFSFLSFLIFYSCTKINEATELGDELIPAVDNVNTFEQIFTLEAAYRPYDDSSRAIINSSFNDFLALGRLNDPLFGTTSADMYFNVGSLAGNKVHPFGVKDSIKGIDSVVLSLAYQGGYGDTSNATQLTVQVSELASNNGFDEDSLYRFDETGFSTTGVLGSRTFSIRNLKDSVPVVRKGDTSKAVNVLRVRLNNSLGERLRNYDTALNANGAYHNDSLFLTLLRGFEIKTTSASGQGALAYFNLINPNTRLIVYYRIGRANGIDSAASVVFGHIRNGQANAIRRTPSAEYLANLNKPSAQKFYIQSSPSGSYVGIRIPGLDTFPNKIIHRAELIAFKENDLSDRTFKEPFRLLLDRKRPMTSTAKDTAYIFENDLQVGFDGSLNFAAFGGSLRSDNSYRFNVTRYVQGIVTRKERNDSLRLYAPLRSTLYAKSLGQFISVPALEFIAAGRVVLAGTTATNPDRRMRLRIVYSNL